MKTTLPVICTVIGPRGHRNKVAYNPAMGDLKIANGFYAITPADFERLRNQGYSKGALRTIRRSLFRHSPTGRKDAAYSIPHNCDNYNKTNAIVTTSEYRDFQRALPR